jgi:hypothetical protein
MIDTAWNVLSGPALLALQNSGAASSSSSGPTPEETAGIFAVLAGAMALICCGSLVVQAIICFFAYTAAKQVPAASQQMSPGLVWLLMIPLFNYIWNFMVFTKVPKSIKAALDARGVPESGDCGAQIGLFYAIAAVASLPLSFIPIINILGGLLALASLVLVIIALIQMNAAAKKLT